VADILATRRRQAEREEKAAEKKGNRKKKEAAIAAQQWMNVGIEALLLEAWRFNPTFPALLRYCPRHEMLREDSRHGTTVPAGSTVLASPLSAMNDPNLFSNPDVFGYWRPREDYMHFGWGGHECLGKELATTVLRELLAHLVPLLQQWNVKPADSIEYDGPAIKRYAVQFVRKPAETGKEGA
jgi:cytochrome P450